MPLGLLVFSGPANPHIRELEMLSRQRYAATNAMRPGHCGPRQNLD